MKEEVKQRQLERKAKLEEAKKQKESTKDHDNRTEVLKANVANYRLINVLQ